MAPTRLVFSPKLNIIQQILFLNQNNLKIVISYRFYIYFVHYWNFVPTGDINPPFDTLFNHIQYIEHIFPRMFKEALLLLPQNNKTIYFFNPGSIHTRSGGTIFNKHIIANLKYTSVDLIEIQGEFPMMSDQSLQQLANRLHQIPKNSLCIVDSLLLSNSLPILNLFFSTQELFHLYICFLQTNLILVLIKKTIFKSSLF